MNDLTKIMCSLTMFVFLFLLSLFTDGFLKVTLVFIGVFVFACAIPMYICECMGENIEG